MTTFSIIGRVSILCLVLTWYASFPLTNALPPQLKAIKALIPCYGVYSIVVDQYAKRTLKRMEAAEEEVSQITDARAFDESVPLLTPAELRKTISKRTNLVTNPLHRKSWRKWCLTRNKGDDSAASAIKPGQTYEFAYRSYVNYEERAGIAVSFYNWKMFGLKHVKAPCEMIIYDQDAIDKANNQYRVSLCDRFSLGLFLPLSIIWYGTIRNPRGSKPRITWNKTEATIVRKKKERPANAEKMASIPWDIVKCDDGMVCFQRGDVGYLVFDKCQ